MAERIVSILSKPMWTEKNKGVHHLLYIEMVDTIIPGDVPGKSIRALSARSGHPGVASYRHSTES